MDRGAWQATVHSVTQRRRQLKRRSTHTHAPRAAPPSIPPQAQSPVCLFLLVSSLTCWARCECFCSITKEEIKIFLIPPGSFFSMVSGSSGEGSGTPLQYSCLENPMGRGDWQATVHGDNRELDATKNIQDKQKNILGAELFDSTCRRYLE